MSLRRRQYLGESVSVRKVLGAIDKHFRGLFDSFESLDDVLSPDDLRKIAKIAGQVKAAKSQFDVLYSKSLKRKFP